MSGIDLFIIVILVASAIWGYTRSIVKQLGSLLAFALALAACHIFGDLATDAVTSMMGGEDTVSDPAQSSMTHFMAACIGHVALFVIVWIGVWFAAKAVKFVAKSLHLGLIDSVGGSLFMLLKAGVVLSFILNFARFMAPNSALGSCNGTISEIVVRLAPALLGFIQPASC